MEHDDPVELSAEFRPTVDGMRSLRKATGRTIAELNEDEFDGIQGSAFLALHKRYAQLGHLPDPGELWERAGRVEISYPEPPPPDPTSGEPSKTSPFSADIGA